MRTMARLPLFFLIAVAGLAGTAEASSSPTSLRRTWFLGEVIGITTRFLRENQAIDEERGLPSMLRMSWGRIKAKYRDPDNPKGR